MMVVWQPLVSVKEEPKDYIQQTDEMLYGDTCEILEEAGKYVKIRSDYGYEGYVLREALTELTVEPNAMVSVPFADFLPEAKNWFAPVSVLPRGARVHVEDYPDRPRYGVGKMHEGEDLYVHKNHLREIPTGEGTEEELREGIVKAALSYLGVQYRWGGRTPAGVDCSGLCFMAYRLNGLTIWRDADFEKNPHLRKITIEEAKPGDLMFFPGHIAMYLGNGEFVHSTAGVGMVVRDTLENAKDLVARMHTVATYF